MAKTGLLRNENKSFQDTITKMKNIVVETKDRHSSLLSLFVQIEKKRKEKSFSIYHKIEDKIEDKVLQKN
ncbi:hypothetical protein DERP_001535 [Dermatophagoides pteronyssinus]|uniref:Uncharacterized protein n=1 Tax=Dermatophagoides pteronyssinus TaxID=6956 RepID=A0ABQ8JAS9_DERPT|nr:hypothetical protein DERP_001535 [Dermatophagoides pteronyssinus]